MVDKVHQIGIFQTVAEKENIAAMKIHRLTLKLARPKEKRHLNTQNLP